MGVVTFPLPSLHSQPNNILHLSEHTEKEPVKKNTSFVILAMHTVVTVINYYHLILEVYNSFLFPDGALSHHTNLTVWIGGLVIFSP